ncbi:MAG: binding-protein-dependent transporter inner rane component [Actinotalea sp.]|nr:binding-protein-dependent transporter inner rane component [Actinotalea sp.]
MLRRLNGWETFASAAAFLLFFGVWHALASSGNFAFIPPIDATLATLGREIGNGALLTAAAESLQVAAVGLAIATVIGLALGIITGVSKSWAQVLDPLVNALYSTPIAVMIPILGIYVGLGMSGKVFIVVMFCVFVIILNTSTAIRQIDKGLVEMARSLDMSTVKIYRVVVMPGAMPQILTGFRIATGRAVQGVLVAELLLSVSGLGYYLVFASSAFETEKLVAGTLFVTLLAFAVLFVVGRLERWTLRWKAFERK